LFNKQFLPEINEFPEPADRLAALVRSYVRFAGAHRPLFEVIFVSGLDKTRHPEVKAAEKPFEDAYTDIVRTLSTDGPESGHLTGEARTPAPESGHLTGEARTPAPESGHLTGEAADLAAAIEAAAYGHAMLLLEGDYCRGGEAVELAADRAARATLALVESRHLLRRPAP
jgi:WHG domain-containing protein